MPVITVLERVRQEDYHECEPILLHGNGFYLQPHSETLYQTAQNKCDASLTSGPLCKASLYSKTFQGSLGPDTDKFMTV